MIFGAMKQQLRSVIEWEDQKDTDLFAQWSANGDEIKNASKLIVKPGQGVLFVYEGKLSAIHREPGMYELKTANIPFITTLTKFMQAFESEHKVGLYFFRLTELLNLKWGTPSPIKYVDSQYRFPVGLRAFGNFSFRLAEPEGFFVNIVGSRTAYDVETARQAIAQRFVQPLTDLLAEASYAFVEIDKHRDELGAALLSKVAPDFAKLGFELTDFRLEGTDFDAETHARVATIANTIADAEAAKAAGLSYAQMQQLQALRDAARNPGGAAGAGAALGAGVGLGQMMAGVMGAGTQGVVAASESPAQRLSKLQELLTAKLITQEEFDRKKADILSSI